MYKEEFSIRFPEKVESHKSVVFGQQTTVGILRDLLIRMKTNELILIICLVGGLGGTVISALLIVWFLNRKGSNFTLFSFFVVTFLIIGNKNIVHPQTSGDSEPIHDNKFDHTLGDATIRRASHVTPSATSSDPRRAHSLLKPSLLSPSFIRVQRNFENT